MLPTTLSDWLALLERRHEKAIDLGLERVRDVASRLISTFSSPVITVAGTNGKGSVIASLASLAHAHELKVGVYTSPHLLRFNERIVVNGNEVSDGDLIVAFNAVEKARETTSLTYFEFTTLAALWLFQQEPLDLVVLEVGMGGRLDAVNIVEPNVSVITTVDFDHMSFLGDTLQAIAHEKAGICRKNVPVVLADAEKLALITQAASSFGARIHAVGDAYHYQAERDFFSYQSTEHSFICDAPHLGADLVAAAVKAFCLALDSRVNKNALIKGVEAACLMGRWQMLATSPTTILDIGHNPQASRRLAQKAFSISSKKWHLVVGLLADKDRAGVLAPWLTMDVDWYFSDLAGPRAGSAEALKRFLPSNARVSCYSDPVLAWRAALARAQNDERILVFGSFLTVASVLEAHPLQ